ncbi:MAG: 16S rRNA (guanine(966)-N(2))-methyltransferase RsmD [Myxococcales bacterium]|nr:16S rRNA (guanine(966)-N(2))-methyltransferase RsmD [Myxococcales bacterium]
MRIVAGSARGRSLLGPRGAKEIRPTADRVRESIFNVLGQWMEGLRVLDLFAGTGALALEAISRGASRAVMVDSGRQAAALCRANAEALGFADRVEVMRQPVDAALAHLARMREQFDLVFADPPYSARAAASVLSQVESSGVLAPAGRLCIEHDRKEAALERGAALVRVDERRFGDTVVSFYAHAGQP